MIETIKVFGEELIVEVYSADLQPFVVIRRWKNNPGRRAITFQEMRYLLDELEQRYPETFEIIMVWDK